MSESNPSRALTILAVDDEPDVRIMVRQMFRRQVRRGSFTLAFAGDGTEALAYVDSGNPVDVVITDINMPRLTGLELLEALRARSCRAATIVVSAYGNMANIRAAMNLGAFDFVTKPVDFADLTATVERAARCLESWGGSGPPDRERSACETELFRAVQRALIPEFASWAARFTVRAGLACVGPFGGDFLDIVRLEADRVGLLAARRAGTS